MCVDDWCRAGEAQVEVGGGDRGQRRRGCVGRRQDGGEGVGRRNGDEDRRGELPVDVFKPGQRAKRGASERERERDWERDWERGEGERATERGCCLRTVGLFRWEAWAAGGRVAPVLLPSSTVRHLRGVRRPMTSRTSLQLRPYEFLEGKRKSSLRGALSCEADSLLHIGSGRVQRSHLCQSLSHSQLIHSAGLSIVPGASSSGAASAGSGADRWQAPAASSQQPAAARRSEVGVRAACAPSRVVRSPRAVSHRPPASACSHPRGSDQISHLLSHPKPPFIRILSSRVWIDPLWLYARVFRSRSCISFIVFFSSWSPWRPWRAALTRVFLAALMGIRALPAEFPSS